MVGRRGDHACRKGQSGEIDLLRAHTFYLSFESSLCAEYITVKWLYFIKWYYIVFLLFILACLRQYRDYLTFRTSMNLAQPQGGLNRHICVCCWRFKRVGQTLHP